MHVRVASLCSAGSTPAGSRFLPRCNVLLRMWLHGSRTAWNGADVERVSDDFVRSLIAHV